MKNGIHLERTGAYPILPKHSTVIWRGLWQGILSVCCARIAWKLWKKRKYGNDATSMTFFKWEVPSWLVYNSHIKGGYRRQCNLCECACSCGTLHNETFNVWSHYMAALWFINSALLSRGSMTQAIAVSSAITMSSSAIAHCFGAAGPRINDWLFRFDRASIALTFMVISWATGRQHYLQRNDPISWILYESLVGVFGAGSMTALFAGSRWSNRIRTSILIGQITIGTIPVLREFVFLERQHGLRLFFEYLLPSSGFALAGAAAYVFQCPETLLKYDEDDKERAAGVFDLFGSSHNIMHVFTALSLYFAHRGLGKWQGI